MNIKKFKILSCLIIFLMMFPFHFEYKVFPNSITSIFFPVNESIWEHMKLIYTTFIFYGVIESIFYYKKKININNLIFNNFISAITCIIIFLIMFLPMYFRFGENMIITFIILFISICITEFISFQLYKKNNIKYLNVISFILIIISYIIFGYLTYNPIKNFMFFDHLKEIYGINTYLICIQCK